MTIDYNDTNVQSFQHIEFDSIDRMQEFGIQLPQQVEIKKKILIVDDEIFNIEAIKIILENRFEIDNINEVCNYAMNGQKAADEVIHNVRTNKSK